ncbi:MAG: Gx transporter family protein [Ruminococcaceae bacterium]|nr:Gx transporter family protein [Oscillospiraceae bacterium]
MNKKFNTRRITLLGLGVAVAMLLSYVEFLLPPLFSAVPGIKIGLANIIIVYLFFKSSVTDAALVSLVRLFLSALLFGSVLTMIYSLAGACLSFCVMLLLKKSGMFSEVGISVLGGIFHNLGQVLVAILILRTREIGYYMIVLVFTGTVAGLFVGVASALMIKHLDLKKYR